MRRTLNKHKLGNIAESYLTHLSIWYVFKSQFGVGSYRSFRRCPFCNNRRAGLFSLWLHSTFHGSQNITFQQHPFRAGPLYLWGIQSTLSKIFSYWWAYLPHSRGSHRSWSRRLSWRWLCIRWCWCFPSCSRCRVAATIARKLSQIFITLSLHPNI